MGIEGSFWRAIAVFRVASLVYARCCWPAPGIPASAWPAGW